MVSYLLQRASTIYPLNHDNGLVVFPQTRHSFSSYSFKFKVYLTMHLTLSKVTPVTPYNSHLSFYLLFHGKFLPSYPFLSPLPWQFFAILSPLPWQILAILSYCIPSSMAISCHLIPFYPLFHSKLLPSYPIFHGKFLPSYPIVSSLPWQIFAILSQVYDSIPHLTPSNMTQQPPSFSSSKL